MNAIKAMNPVAVYTSDDGELASVVVSVANGKYGVRFYGVHPEGDLHMITAKNGYELAEANTFAESLIG